MASIPQDLPICSRLLGRDEVNFHLWMASEWAHMADRVESILPPDADPLDREELRGWREEAARHREFRRAVRPGDRVWLTATPPSHPEVEFGTPFLVVVRGGQAVGRYRLEIGPGYGPILPPTKRLTSDEAVAIASEWVRARYPEVPPVDFAYEIPERAIDSVEARGGHEVSREARRQVANTWVVIFATSEETNGPGMPARLRVHVDDETGRAKFYE